jgi:hypothetical protein
LLFRLGKPFGPERRSFDLAGACTHRFPTSAGTREPARRAATATEISQISLSEALELTVLIARKEPTSKGRRALAAAPTYRSAKPQVRLTTTT